MDELISYLKLQPQTEQVQAWVRMLELRTSELEEAAKLAGGRCLSTDYGTIKAFQQQDWQRFALMAGRHATNEIAEKLANFSADLAIAGNDKVKLEAVKGNLERYRRKLLREI